MKHHVALVVVLLLAFTPTVVYAQDPTFLEFSKGNIPGHVTRHINGINDDISNVYEDIWEVGGTYVFPTVANYLNVSSVDADDTLLGTGARTVIINGLDANWNQITETVNMSGATLSATVNKYIRLNNAYTDDVGVSGVNEGNITITSGALTLGFIDDGHGSMQQAIYSIPAGHKAYLLGFGIGSTEDKVMEFELLYRQYGKSWTVIEQINGYRITLVYERGSPIPLEAKSDIRWCAETTVPSSITGFAHFDFVLVDDAFSDVEIIVTQTSILGEVDARILGVDELVMLALLFLTAVASYWSGYVEDDPDKSMILLTTSFILWLVVSYMWAVVLPDMAFIVFLFILPLAVILVTFYRKLQGNV